jgi:pimeloyl-ACP methyl ester carboxylesterase
MSSFFIPYKSSQIHCSQWGTGEKPLLCFHGFGENADSFTSLARQLGDTYTIIAIDLPLHGKTVWNEGMMCTTEDIVSIINNIPALYNHRFSLAGYSMGGRVALSVYEQIPQRIQQLILLAPDGLKINFWYWLATQTALGNRLFKYFMKKPGIFFTVTKALKRTGMINTGVYTYVHQYLNQEDKRIQLYTIWTTMRKLRPAVKNIKALIQKNKTPVFLIYGRYDRVIRHTTGSAFKKGMEDICILHILPCGHRILHEKNTAAIAALLQ